MGKSWDHVGKSSKNGVVHEKKKIYKWWNPPWKPMELSNQHDYRRKLWLETTISDYINVDDDDDDDVDDDEMDDDDGLWRWWWEFFKS